MLIEKRCIDIKMPEMNGVKAIRQILALLLIPDDCLTLVMLRARDAGHLKMGVNFDKLTVAIRKAADSGNPKSRQRLTFFSHLFSLHLTSKMITDSNLYQSL
jgi:hypothetical protein